MTLGNMRELGVHHLIAFCLNDACRHQALIDVSSYPENDADVRHSGGGLSAASAAAAATRLTCARTGRRNFVGKGCHRQDGHLPFEVTQRANVLVWMTACHADFSRGAGCVLADCRCLLLQMARLAQRCS